MQYICDRCKYGNREQKEAIAKAWLDEIETKGERRFNQALDRIQKQVRDFSKYEKAVEIARTMQDRYGSVPEAMVAVELIRLGYSIIPQQKVGKYRVDFYIPKEKIVIEVDGAIYHRDRFGGNREAEVNLMLGLDTRIIHIPAELIGQKIWKLKECIEVGMKLP
jgi:very-short-patch-repair endonuclease